jgi:hypothetical protein
VPLSALGDGIDAIAILAFGRGFYKGLGIGAAIGMRHARQHGGNRRIVRENGNGVDVLGVGRAQDQVFAQ